MKSSEADDPSLQSAKRSSVRRKGDLSIKSSQSPRRHGRRPGRAMSGSVLIAAVHESAVGPKRTFR
jgi:hypothetical protein